MSSLIYMSVVLDRHGMRDLETTWRSPSHSLKIMLKGTFVIAKHLMFFECLLLFVLSICIISRLNTSSSQVEQLQHEKSHVEQRLAELLRRNNDSENRGREAVLRASENLQLVETSIIERDQVHIVVHIYWSDFAAV